MSWSEGSIFWGRSIQQQRTSAVRVITQMYMCNMCVSPIVVGIIRNAFHSEQSTAAAVITAGAAPNTKHRPSSLPPAVSIPSHVPHMNSGDSAHHHHRLRRPRWRSLRGALVCCLLLAAPALASWLFREALLRRLTVYGLQNVVGAGALRNAPVSLGTLVIVDRWAVELRGLQIGNAPGNWSAPFALRCERLRVAVSGPAALLSLLQARARSGAVWWRIAPGHRCVCYYRVRRAGTSSSSHPDLAFCEPRRGASHPGLAFYTNRDVACHIRASPFVRTATWRVTYGSRLLNEPRRGASHPGLASSPRPPPRVTVGKRRFPRTRRSCLRPRPLGRRAGSCGSAGSS